MIKVRLLLGTASSLKLGSFDFSACHLLAKELLATEKALMVVTSGIRTSRQALETVKIQLALKGRQLSLTEIPRNTDLKKLEPDKDLTDM